MKKIIRMLKNLWLIALLVIAIMAALLLVLIEQKASYSKFRDKMR